VYVHHGNEARTPRTMKSPIPSAPNVDVVLRHFHRHCLEQPAVVLCWRGLISLELSLWRNTVDTRIYVVRAARA
jgi:hypothetical protein